jgi:hypothetical protein
MDHGPYGPKSKWLENMRINGSRIHRNTRCAKEGKMGSKPKRAGLGKENERREITSKMGFPNQFERKGFISK